MNKKTVKVIFVLDERKSKDRSCGRNLQYGSRVAIAVVDREKMKGFRFVGAPEIITSGELDVQATTVAAKRPGGTSPKAVIKVKIEMIFNLGVPGAGDEI